MEGFEYGNGDTMVDSFRSSTPIATLKIITRKTEKKCGKICFAYIAERIREMEK